MRIDIQERGKEDSDYDETKQIYSLVCFHGFPQSQLHLQEYGNFRTLKDN